MKDPPDLPRRLMSSRRCSAMRVAAVLCLPILAGCAKSAPPALPVVTAPVDEHKLCADDHWRDEHPGLSFDVCHSNAMNAD